MPEDVPLPSNTMRIVEPTSSVTITCFLSRPIGESLGSRCHFDLTLIVYLLQIKTVEMNVSYHSSLRQDKRVYQ